MSSQFDAVYPVKGEADISIAMLSLGRDTTFTLEMRTWARMVTAAGRKAFLYQFTHVPPGPAAKTRGAYHASAMRAARAIAFSACPPIQIGGPGR